MKRKLIIIISIVVILAVSISVTAVRIMRSEKESDRIEVVRRGPFVVKLTERGNLDALVKVEVRSNVEGEIEKLYVDEGYDVVKGQELLKIDEKQIREEYNQAQANYNAAEADMEQAKENVKLSVDKLKSEIQLAESNLKSAQANQAEIKARSAQQVSQTQSTIRGQESLLEQDEISLKKAKLALEQAESAEKSAKTKLDNAKAELNRKTELYDKKFVALREVENAQLEYSSAQSQYESAQKNVQSQKESVQSQEKIIESRKVNLQAEKNNMKILEDSLNEQKKQAEIQVQQAEERSSLLKKSENSEKQIVELTRKSAEANLIRAKSVLNKARERLGWTTVVAPMTGRIVQCQVEEGELVISGRSAWSQTPPIMIIADLSKMIVKTQVHEIDIGKVKVGQKAEIKVSSYPDDIFEGEVKEISSSAQFIDNIIKFEVTVMITKAPKPLLPGMTADVDIIVGERDNVLQLPLEAIIIKETIKIRTDMRKEIANRLKDQEVEIVLSSFPDKKFPGKVAEISPERQGFLTSEVTIIMKGSPKELQPGTSSTADMIVSGGEKIPGIEARIGSETEHYVRLIKETGTESDKAEDEERLIKVGDRTQSSIEILDGLKEGDKVRVVPIGEEEEKKKKRKKASAD